MLDLYKPTISHIKDLGNDTYDIIISPCSKGISQIIGNSLRRILLSSIPGYAVTWVKISEVYHEFSSLNGSYQDSVEILLNLKKLGVCIVSDLDEVSTSINCSGPMIITASEIEKVSPHIRVANPKHVIATLKKGGNLNMELKITRGYGFIPSSFYTQSQDIDRFPGYIPLDAFFNPILNVSFSVKELSFLVEELSLKIQTKGTILPKKAINIAMIYFYEQLSVLKNLEPFNEDKKENVSKTEVPTVLSKSINDLDLTVRSANCLKAQNIYYLRDLVKYSESDLMSIPNLGKKSLNEIKAILLGLDLFLGMSEKKK